MGTNVVAVINEVIVVLVEAFDVVESIVVVFSSFDWVAFTLWVERPSRVAAMEKENTLCGTYYCLISFLLS